MTQPATSPTDPVPHQDAELADASAPSPAPQVGAAEFAAFLAARMCHDYISPAGAIVSGLDLLEDPSAQDMRAEAMELIAASAKKLVAALSFDRVAFGSSASAESFDPRQLETLTRDVFAHVRADVDWSVEATVLNKPAARTLLNLAQIGAGVLPMGGLARVTARQEGEQLVVAVRATGPRVRMRPEVLSGLSGQALGEGLGGHWVQAYYLRLIVDGAGGSLEVAAGDVDVCVTARLPL